MASLKNGMGLRTKMYNNDKMRKTKVFMIEHEDNLRTLSSDNFEGSFVLLIPAHNCLNPILECLNGLLVRLSKSQSVKITCRLYFL